MPQESIKDKLEGNELDLSLNNLTVVPVKEMLPLRQARRVDLSCNLLISIPDDFLKMDWITRLDLSKNKILALPDDFGSLKKLEHLDLFNNRLVALPVSMCFLKNLKWLDVKDNPLDETMKKVAGDCLDDLQCKSCAKRVVAFMKDLSSHQERRRQQQLQEQRELDALKKQEEEQLRQEKRAEKAAEKERKRAVYAQLQEEKRQVETEAAGEHSDQSQETVKEMNGFAQTPSQSSGMSWCKMIFVILVALVAMVVGGYMYCEATNFKASPVCRTLQQTELSLIFDIVKMETNKLSHKIMSLLPK